MEEELTLEEVFALVEAMHRTEHRHNKFSAAVAGVDLDDNKSTDAFDKVKLKAQADLAGKDEDEFVLTSLGFEIEDDDEDDY